MEDETDSSDRLGLDLFRVIEAARVLWESAGVQEFLETAQPWLEGRTPAQAVSDGDAETVLAWLQSKAQGHQ